MANPVLQFLITARDEATAAFGKIFGFLDKTTSATANLIREKFTGLFGGGLDGAIEFEAQLSRVAAKGGFTADEMATLKKAATDIGAAFGVTGTQAAQGMEALAAAGLNARQVMQALPPVLALAKAEGLSMDAAAEKLADSLSIVGLGFEEAGRMADVLAKGANVSTTSASALAEALANAGGIAKTAGLDLEGTVAALSALANAGIKGSAAGTALSAILTNLVNPASQASKELSALGITSRDFGEVIAQLKLKGDASNAAILAFGETAGPGLRALIQTGADGIAGLEDQLRNADGAAEAAATRIGDNLKGALGALQAAWANVKTALFDPVLEPLTRQAKGLADALNTQLASGALKPVQDAIRAFADNATKAARDFVSGFDFKAALQSVQDFATGAKDWFAGIKDAGTTAANAVQIAWNSVTAGFKTIGASLLAVAASAVSNVAAIEEVASKIGLGSLQRAAELKATANELAAKAGELTRSIAQDGEDIRGAFDRLTASADGAADGANKVADAQRGIKDSSPAQEIQEIARSLDDYRGMAERANLAAEQARRDYEAGKISAADYGRALLSASEANADLAAATERQTAAEQKANPERKKSAVELQAIAKSAEDSAKRHGDYATQLQRTGDAQADAIREEIALARAKGDTATVAVKTIELARVEADTARKVAEAKQQEAAELAKVVVAQQAYLESVGGGTAAQQQELQILQLKLQALQAEAAQAGTTAQAKALAATQTDNAARAERRHAQASEDAAESSEKSAEAAEKQAKTYTLMEDAATGALRELSGLSKGMNDLLSASLGLQDIGKLFGNQWTDELGKLKLALNQTNQVLEHNAKIISPLVGLGFEQMADAANTARKMYLEQAIAATELAGRLVDMTNSAQLSRTALEDITRTAEQNIQGMQLLDEQTLDQLQSAIDSANAKLQQMREQADDARDALARLNAEIAAEKGDDETARRLELEIEQHQRLGEVEGNLEAARAAGNHELIALYEQQRVKLLELFRLKERNLEADVKAERSGERTRSTLSAVADEAERAERALSKLGGANLGGLVNQSGQLTANMRDLNALL